MAGDVVRFDELYEQHVAEVVESYVARPQSKAQSFLTRLQELSDQNVQTAIRKNKDYATSEDPFANFRASEALGVSTARGILVRVSDKLARAANLLDRPPAVTEESLDDTLADASNYLNILRVFLEFERDNQGL